MLISPKSGWTVEQVDTLLFNAFMGVFLGGRIGDVFFYNFDHFYARSAVFIPCLGRGNVIPRWINWGDYLNDLDLLFSKKKLLADSRFYGAFDPFGLGMGRIGNFINLELWGRETDVPWAMIFPNDPLLLPRHPSQLYEAFLEGFVLFIILNVFIKKPRPAGSVAGLFLVGYGIFRFYR